MKLFTSLLAVLFLFTTACSTSMRAEMKVPSDIGYLYESVGLVEVVDRNGNSMVSATAFAYDKDLLLTAAHVCLSALEVQIFVTRQPSVTITYTDHRGVMRRAVDLEVVDISPTDDICMLRSENHGMRPVVLADNNNLRVRDEVVIIGAPLGVAIGEFPGRVMDLQSKMQNPMLRDRLIVSSAATGGVSGSPVFNKYGHVIGILVAGPQSFDHLSICVGLKPLKKFLKDSGY